jgi:hypothetical protein
LLARSEPRGAKESILAGSLSRACASFTVWKPRAVSLREKLQASCSNRNRERLPSGLNRLVPDPYNIHENGVRGDLAE